MNKILNNLYVEIFKHAVVIGAGLAAGGVAVVGTAKAVKSGVIKMAIAKMTGGSKTDNNESAVDITGGQED